MYLQEEIVTWAERKGIFVAPSFTTQIKGIAEETVEVTEAYTSHKHCCGPISDVQKEMGDIYVWWINACATIGLEPEECIRLAYEKIAKRTGHVNDQGRFVKDES